MFHIAYAAFPPMLVVLTGVSSCPSCLLSYLTRKSHAHVWLVSSGCFIIINIRVQLHLPSFLKYVKQLQNDVLARLDFQNSKQLKQNANQPLRSQKFRDFNYLQVLMFTYQEIQKLHTTMWISVQLTKYVKFSTELPCIIVTDYLSLLQQLHGQIVLNYIQEWLLSWNRDKWSLIPPSHYIQAFPHKEQF